MLNQPHTFPVFIASLCFILTICHFILFCVVKTKLRDLRSINNWVDNCQYSLKISQYSYCYCSHGGCIES